MSVLLDFIKSHEGCKLAAYQDSGGIWTIGYGAIGPEVRQGVVWTQDEAEARLIADLAATTTKVRALVHVPISKGQEAALVSFAFNLGNGALASSHLLTLVHQKEWLLAAKEFAKWDHVGQREIRGLLIRRLEEAVMFLKDSPST